MNLNFLNTVFTLDIIHLSKKSLSLCKLLSINFSSLNLNYVIIT